MAEIEMKPVVSTRVKALGYDAETQTLRAEFPNGRRCDYEGVPPEVYAEMEKSTSIGAAFGALIVGGGYPFKYV